MNPQVNTAGKCAAMDKCDTTRAALLGGTAALRARSDTKRADPAGQTRLMPSASTISFHMVNVRRLPIKPPIFGEFSVLFASLRCAHCSDAHGVFIFAPLACHSARAAGLPRQQPAAARLCVALRTEDDAK